MLDAQRKPRDSTGRPRGELGARPREPVNVRPLLVGSGCDRTLKGNAGRRGFHSVQGRTAEEDNR